MESNCRSRMTAEGVLVWFPFLWSIKVHDYYGGMVSERPHFRKQESACDLADNCRVGQPGSAAGDVR